MACSCVLDLAVLENLALSFNAVSGTLPPQYGQLQTLLALWVSFNRITGSIPTSYGMLTKLQDIGVQDNNLTGAVPSDLANLNITGECFMSVVCGVSCVSPLVGPFVSVCPGRCPGGWVPAPVALCGGPGSFPEKKRSA